MESSKIQVLHLCLLGKVTGAKNFGKVVLCITIGGEDVFWWGHQTGDSGNGSG